MASPSFPPVHAPDDDITFVKTVAFTVATGGPSVVQYAIPLESVATTYGKPFGKRALIDMEICKNGATGNCGSSETKVIPGTDTDANAAFNIGRDVLICNYWLETVAIKDEKIMFYIPWTRVLLLLR